MHVYVITTWFVSNLKVSIVYNYDNQLMVEFQLRVFNFILWNHTLLKQNKIVIFIKIYKRGRWSNGNNIIYNCRLGLITYTSYITHVVSVFT
jgi:hypothetical protein